MGIFDSLFHSKPKAPEGNKHTLIVFDWDSFSHEQNYQFLEQYENPVLWFVTRGKWDPRWDVLKSKYSVKHLEVPAYERSLSNFLMCSLIYEVASNRSIYKKVVIAAGHSFLKGTVSFLLEKKILAELFEVDPRFPNRDRNTTRRGNEQGSQIDERSQRTNRERNERSSGRDRERDASTRGGARNPTPKETSRDSFRDNSRNSVNEKDAMTGQLRENRVERNRDSSLHNRSKQSDSSHHDSQTEEHKQRVAPERVVSDRKKQSSDDHHEIRNKIAPSDHQDFHQNENDPENTPLSHGSLPSSEDLKLIVQYFNQHYLVGETYQKSFFGMLIKQATRRTATEVLGSKNAKPFIQVLMRNGCIEQLDSQTFKVLKPVELEMFNGSRSSNRKRPYNRPPRRRTSSAE